MKKFRIKFVIIFLIMLILICTIPINKSLIVKSDQDKVLLDLDEWQTFDYSYIHSVSLTSVRESYEISNDQLVLVSVLFQDQGAGLPQADGSQSVISMTKNGFLKSGDLIHLETLTVSATDKYDNHLETQKNTVKLVNMPSSNSIRQIYVGNITLLDWLVAQF